jgi:hypothetical protein
VELLEFGVFGWKNLERSWFSDLELGEAAPNTPIIVETVVAQTSSNT